MIDYRQHPEYLALLETVRMFPQDDAPRGILADWIQEAGDDDRAEFIREQLKNPADVRRCLGAWTDSLPCGRGDEPDYCEHCLMAVADEVPPILIGFESYGYRRGFVSEIHLECDPFLSHAAMLFGRYPITRIVIIGAVFGHPQGRIAHWDLGKTLLERFPKSITDRGHWGGYNQRMTTEKALAVVSEACISYGRELAGLPVLQDH
ncbi:TIGR02996 domain-containing protein [Zavarzinella formosa]|uniref:TIGR02996 domain-containing protein n=1 Tax=Zavarzinella formosa TaxID=360055 RepID=UPI00036AF0D9|nr:TIGR02996 domain-containing protein [Zavarzinella formosa]